MAEVDEELNELLSALNSSGYSWLTAEVLMELEEGEPNMASSEELREVRERVGNRDDSVKFERIGSGGTANKRWDDPTDTALNIIKQRFAQVDKILHETIKHITSIARDESGVHIKVGLGFAVDGVNRPVTDADIQKVSDGLAKLDEALTSWRYPARGQTL